MKARTDDQIMEALRENGLCIAENVFAMVAEKEPLNLAPLKRRRLKTSSSALDQDVTQPTRKPSPLSRKV